MLFHHSLHIKGNGQQISDCLEPGIPYRVIEHMFFRHLGRPSPPPDHLTPSCNPFSTTESEA